MRSGMKVALLDIAEKSKVFRGSDFHFDEYDYLYCRLVPQSSFIVGSREDGGFVYERPGVSFMGMSGGGTRTTSKAGYKVGLRPGLVNTSEDHHVFDGKQVLALFKKWLAVLEEEFSSGPAMRWIVELDAAVEALRQGVEDIDQEAEFTSKEIEEIQEALARLQERLTEQAEAAEEAQQQLQQARKDIEWLRQMVGQMKKRTWREAFAARLGPIFATASTEGTKLVIKEVVSAGVKLLGGPSEDG